MLRTLFRPGPGWLIITVVVALFALEITALAVATREVSQTSRAGDMLRLLLGTNTEELPPGAAFGGEGRRRGGVDPEGAAGT